jgi:hypothetical protein
VFGELEGASSRANPRRTRHRSRCPLALAPEILARCLVIIGPAAEERERCCSEISLSFDLLTWDVRVAVELMPLIDALRGDVDAGLVADKITQLADRIDSASYRRLPAYQILNQSLKTAEWSADARQFARIMNSAAVLMRNKPLLFIDIAGEGQNAEKEWERVRDYLAARASAAQRVVEKFKVQTRPPNRLKLTCAMCAFDLLEKFSAQRPTLSDAKGDGGAFYRLAAVLYEAVTEEQDASLQRQCRSIFHQLRGRSG